MTRYEQSLWGKSSSVGSHTSIRTNIAFPFFEFEIHEPNWQSPTEDDGSRRERLDALLREAVNPANGTCEDQWRACEDDTRWRREWKEEVQRWVVGQRRLEQDGTIRQQREADHNHAARTSREGEAGLVMPVSSASATTASASGPITAYLLEGPCNKPDKP